MGAALGRALLKQDFEVLAWNRTRSRTEPLAGDGALVVDGYLALFGKAEPADKLTADFAAMSQFMKATA